MSRYTLQLTNPTVHAGFATRLFAAALVAMLFTGLASAVEVPERSALGEKELRHPDLDISAVLRRPAELPVGKGAALADGDLAALGVPEDRGWLDARSGRWATLTPRQPLMPGRGVGNELSWEDLGRSEPASDAAWRAAVADVFRGYLERHAVLLRIDVSELAGLGRATVHEGGAVAQMYLPRVVQGLPVRGSYLTAVINHGNLVLFGAHNWGDVEVSTTPKVSAAEALAEVEAHVAPFIVGGSWGKDELIIVPMARGQEVTRLELGQGYAHRLAWVIRPRLVEDLGRWEALVDAHSGELLSFEDTNRYAEIVGGVYPVTNDGVVPDGVEQLGWPMPFQDVSTTSGTLTTDTGGNLTATGSMTATFFGPYVNINDNCGAESLTQNDNIDWGGSGGTDCVTPGFGGAGNTHASRTGFYELNRIIEMGRSQLPSNTWLQSRLTANMNINNTCNAFWGGGTVNFYRSGGGCFNTGEIAGVFDHEWGHGLDDNDANPTISGPSGEGIADIYTALRLDTSCIGRHFRATNCTGFGDPCLDCTGVRDIDYLKRASGNPHDYTWSNANCGGSVHCVGAVYAEAVWSLWKRKLQVAPYNYDNNTAHEIVNRLSFIGAGAVGTWFSGGPPNGGCAGGSGYMNYLAADDDNGNLNDGTPHMQAIFDAFDDQEIACPTPTVQDAGCAGVPTAQPVVTANPGNQQIDLSWGAVGGATSYDVFRTEGVFACDFGKVKIGSTAGTSFNDAGLQNGRDYSYLVVPKSSAACFGPASACTTAAPAAGPDLSIDTSSTSLAFTSGDGDVYLDNCESATVTFDVINVGLGSLTNPRILAVTPSNAGVTISTAFPAAIAPSPLPQGATGSGSFSLTAGGLVPGETLTLQVEVTADELASSKVADLVVTSTETDLTLLPSLSYSFETDTEGWSTVQGTFVRSSAGGGANGTSWYEQSSANQDDQCDQIQSPVVVLSPTSTLTLYNQFDIEPFYVPGAAWYDRANIGVFEVAGGTRTPVDPDGGRLYNATGPNGNCGTDGQDGWADAATSWGTSSWSAAALGSAGFAGQQVRLDVRYGTDFVLNGFGFHFDEVTLTDVSTPGSDGQTDICGGCTVDLDCDDGTFCNGAETCDVPTGVCQPGTAPACDDGAFCNGVETCNETTDTCDAGTAPACDDGAFCNGAETCNEATDTCDPGTAPVCDDGAFCNGTETCNEGTDSCDAGTPPACDDGAFCNGAETCNEGTDTCDPGTAPVCDDGAFCNGTETCNEGTDTCDAGTPPACGDGVGCTVDSCNEGTDSCDNLPDDGLCDNGLFCDGVETCDVALDCQSGSDPCPGQSCDETADICEPLCSSTLPLPHGVPNGSGWEQISMPCDPGVADTVADVFGDDLAGVYGTDWIMHRRDEATGNYIQLALGDPLVVGEGYWIKTLLAGQSVSMGNDVNAGAGIPLTGVAAPPPAGCVNSAGQCNIVGSPHNFDVCWADVLVDDGGVLKDLATVDPSGSCQTTGAGCVMSRIGHKWTGSSYAPFDGITPGMEGTLVPWDGFWVSANKPGISLQIPATPGSCGPPFANRVDSRSGGPSDWYGRLIVESGTLEDRANVFGELSDSVDAYDSHDLQELPPFGDGFLTVVFPHAEWGVQAGDYSSDFRELGTSRTQSWHFVVRSSDEQADVVLRWEVPQNQLERSTLIDLGSDEEIVPASDGSYTFTMNGTERGFAWVIR